MQLMVWAWEDNVAKFCVFFSEAMQSHSHSNVTSAMATIDHDGEQMFEQWTNGSVVTPLGC